MTSRAFRSYSISDVAAPALLKCLRADRPDDSPELRDLWASYRKDRNAADFGRLVEVYAPFVRIVSANLARGYPDLFANGIGDCISDGLLALIQTIPAYDDLDIEHFEWKVVHAIRRAIWRGMNAQRFGGYGRQEKWCSVVKVRDKLQARLCRPPTRDETIAAVGASLARPYRYMGFVDDSPRKSVSLSQLMKPEYRQAFQCDDPRSPQPADAVVDAEAIGIALNGLSTRDRTIFKLMVEGHGPKEIGKAIGISRAAARHCVNRLGWMARGRAELAAYLGVAPDPAMPERGPDRHLPTFIPTPAPLARLAG